MTIGILCEYNPFHHGHMYHIQKIREKYPDSTLILVLNGYFLQRGEVSILSKEDKTRLALSFGVDIVVELPVLYGTQAADYFAECGIKILHEMKANIFIFGSESNHISFLENLASIQLDDNFSFRSLKNENYPTALARNLQVDQIYPNDLLGISYLKANIKANYPMKMECIQRTNHYHDKELEHSIVSASNIREKLKQNKDITSYLPKESKDKICLYQEALLFQLIKYKILTDDHLDCYLDVVEGLDFKLKKEIHFCQTIEELATRLKSKRYTFNRIHRMFIHILLGIQKKDAQTTMTYIHVLGFNERGRNYLKEKRKEITLPFSIDYDSPIYQYEIRASKIYEMLTGQSVYEFEYKNQPIMHSLLKDSSQK